MTNNIKDTMLGVWGDGSAGTCMPMGLRGRSSSSTASNRATLGTRYLTMPSRGEDSRP